MRPEMTAADEERDPELQPAEDRVSSLMRIAPLLWPEPSRVTLGHAVSGADTGRHYLVLPTATDPRRIVPVRPRLVAAAAVRHSSADESLSTRGKSLVLGASLALGIGQRLLRDRLTISTSGAHAAASIEDHLSSVFGQPVSVSLRLGPPRANLKPVLEVLDRRGTSLGYAKVGINELTSRLVHHERRVLDDLARSHPAVICAPTVLSFESWRDLSVLVLSSLPRGTTRRAPSSEVVARGMVEVASVGGTTRQPLRLSPFSRALRARVGAVRGHPWGDRVAEPVLATLHELADSSFSFGRWHGDWHPGNMAAGTNGRLLLWDWERSSDNAPVGLDALHLLLQTGVLRGRPPAESLRRLRAGAPQALSAYGVEPVVADDVARLYCAEILLRYTEDRQWTIPWAQDLMQQLLASLRSWKGSPCH